MREQITYKILYKLFCKIFFCNYLLILLLPHLCFSYLPIVCMWMHVINYMMVSKLHKWKQIVLIPVNVEVNMHQETGDLGLGASSTPIGRKAYILFRFSRRLISSCLVGAHWWPFSHSTYIINNQEDFMFFLLKKQVGAVKCKNLHRAQMPRCNVYKVYKFPLIFTLAMVSEFRI